MKSLPEKLTKTLKDLQNTSEDFKLISERYFYILSLTEAVNHFTSQVSEVLRNMYLIGAYTFPLEAMLSIQAQVSTLLCTFISNATLDTYKKTQIEGVAKNHDELIQAWLKAVQANTLNTHIDEDTEEQEGKDDIQADNTSFDTQELDDELESMHEDILDYSQGKSSYIKDG